MSGKFKLIIHAMAVLMIVVLFSFSYYFGYSLVENDKYNQFCGKVISYEQDGEDIIVEIEVFSKKEVIRKIRITKDADFKDMQSEWLIDHIQIGMEIEAFCHDNMRDFNGIYSSYKIGVFTGTPIES